MRIAIFTEEDYTFLFPSWVETIEQLQNAGHIVVGLCVFPTVLGKYRGFAIYWYYYKTFGLFTFLKLAVVALSARLRQYRNSLRGYPTTYKKLTKKVNAKFLRAKNPNDPEVVDWTKSNHIDLIFITLGSIIKKPLLEAVTVAILNKHSSILPSFRGLLPVFWTLLHDGIVGSTVHKVNEKIDAGEILFQKSYVDRNRLSVFEYYRKIYSDLAGSLLQTIEILEGKREKTPISKKSEPSYFGLPRKNDYVKFKNKGFKFV